MTAILSQMDDRHYSTYIETFSGTTDLVVSASHTYPQMAENWIFFKTGVFIEPSDK